MQALDTLAEEYGAFEVTMKKVAFEHEEEDVLHAVALELGRAQKDQARLQDELECTCEDLATASKEFSNCWATHEAASAKLSRAFREVSDRRATHEAICEVRKACHKTSELKRKDTEAQEKIMSHRKRTRRIAKEHTRAGALVNDSLGILVCCVREAAAAAHCLTCGVMDREKQRDQVSP